MPLVVHCLLQSLLSLIASRQTAAGPSLPLQVRSNRDEPPFEESLSDSEDSVRSSTVKSTTTDAESNSYYTRLDFISVVVICAVCALCFGVCVVLGCRKKKRHLSSHGLTGSSSSPPSFTDSRSEPRITNLINLPSELRIPETPPPTYSIIERQTSFTSYVSQTSSQWEIPPNYDEAVSLGKAAAATGGGEPFANQIGCKASTTARSDRSAGLRLLPTRVASTVAARSKRSESARTYCPPRARRFYHSSSDVGRMHRTRLLSRPATVSEDDSPPIVNTTSSAAAVAEDSPSGRITAQHAQLNTSQTFGVSTEVFPHAWHAHCSTAERYPKTNLFNSHT